LNQTLVRHLRSIHPNSLLKNRELKWVLKECAKGIVPDSIIFRKDKMGFTTPIGNFINNSAHHIREQITNSSFKHLYNFKKINFTAETKYSREIFGLIILDLWLNRYMKAQQKHGT